ncbi:hypothetical protein BC938DRAFT_477442 [Jimgerdemannia flammicorona]|uniref:AAA-ATPase-like domain-containing protein n=1 Tax=Jimgerdemannia flammicorona TaxID=994334 RepID=A0A433P9T7_9FUNG|nr:hypothetical protein BC938DRAFT_477442 [Jimgerdemannia flammicorona]
MPLSKQKIAKPTHRTTRTLVRSAAKEAPTRGAKRKAGELPPIKAAKLQRTGCGSKAKVSVVENPEPCRVPVLGANNAALLPGGKLGVGNSDFKELATSRFSLVDKSMLIAELCDVGDKVTLLLCPQQFGKTTNLSMLHLFFECIDGESKYEHELWRALFGGMKIVKERPDVMTNEFGKYPVIYLSLKVGYK